MKGKEVKREDERKGGLPFLLVFFVFSAICIVLSVLCLAEIKNVFVQKHFGIVCIGALAIILLLYGVSAGLAISGKDALTKGALSLYILLVFALFLCLLFQKTGFFEMIQTPESLQAYLEKTGVWMPILYILLQFLQVVILPIPSFVSTVAGVALFGPFSAMLYSIVGILSGTAVAFFIGRKLGNKAVAWMVGEDTLQKWQKKLKGKDNLILTVMFVLPLFPDDVLCFLAGLSTMSTKYFFTVIFLSRIVGISTSCYSIDLIPVNTWWGICIWIALVVAVIVAFVLVYKNMDKIQQYFQHRKKRKRKR